MQVGGGVSQTAQLRPKLSIAPRAEQNPTSVSHPADTFSRKGRRITALPQRFTAAIRLRPSQAQQQGLIA